MKCGTRRALVGPGIDLDAAPVPIDDFLGHPQTQPRAHILFSGEERLEDSVSYLRSNTRAVVFNHHLNEPTLRPLHAFQFYPYRSVAIDRIGRVGNKICDGLLQLS